ncbi:MAG: hypothetical protein ABJC13_16655 [Acidobacteriota bacterium]
MIFSLAPASPRARRTFSCALVLLWMSVAGLPAFAARAPKAPKAPKAAKTSGRHRAAAKNERPAETANADNPKTPEAPEPEYHPVPVNPDLPSEISITPHFSVRDRQVRDQRDGDRLRLLAPRAQAWTRAFRAEGPPFARFVAETLQTLRSAIGRGSRNVCYPLQVATERLAANLPEAPEPRLETEIRSALSRVANGARICLEGRPATAQTEIGGGAAVLARAAETIVNWGR